MTPHWLPHSQPAPGGLMQKQRTWRSPRCPHCPILNRQSHDFLPSWGKSTLEPSCLRSCPGTTGKLDMASDTAIDQALTVLRALRV